MVMVSGGGRVRRPAREAMRGLMYRRLYPPIEPDDHGRLEVGDGHEMYWEQCGTGTGHPVLFLHGGPGGGCDGNNRCYFDPDAYRIVLFDQRGAGRSTPAGCVAHNTTQHLIADIERLRTHLGIDRWLVFGGSWGSTLALAYAEEHPGRVTGLILRGVFLGSRAEVDWVSRADGVARFYPELWRRFVEPIPEDEREDLVAAYHRRLFGDDEAARARCARAWSMWEASLCRLVPDMDEIEAMCAPELSISVARVESHYFMNHCFLKVNHLLDHVPRLAGIPGIIVQGRYDLVCPPAAAWNLHRAWPASRLEFVATAGHSASEPALRDALLRATDAFRDGSGSER
ncbi:MAG: prolyl aminopeptidase [Acidobacteriota bacterium]